MFAPPYSPNKKFSNSKIFPNNLKKSSSLSRKYCLRCQMKSQDSKYLSKKITKINPLSAYASHKTLPNLKSLSSIHTELNANHDKNELNKFDPFSTFGQKHSNNFLITMKENKTTSLSLERFKKELKGQHKILYKKFIIQSTRINKKPLTKKPGKIQFENKKIYKLYESLRDKYEKLKAEYDQKMQIFQNHKKSNPIVSKKRNSIIKEHKNNGQCVEQSYQIRTQWAVKGCKQRDSPKSNTSIEQQECFVSDNETKMNQKDQMRIAQVQKEKQFYKQQCLGLQKQLHSVYNIVMELKKQIQDLNEKSGPKDHELVSINSQNYQFHRRSIQSSEFYHESITKQSIPQEGFCQNYVSPISQPSIFILNSLDSHVNRFLTQESIQSPSSIIKIQKKQDQKLQQKLFENQTSKKYQKDDKVTTQIKKENVRKIWRKIICDSNANNLIEEGPESIVNNDSKVSGTTWIGSSGISQVISQKWGMQKQSQNRLYGGNHSTVSPNLKSQTRYYQSESLIKGTDYSQTKPHINTVSVNRYHSYCRKNCELNECRCLLEMMTVCSSKNIAQMSCN